MRMSLRHGLIAIGSGVWGAGLLAQLHSSTTIATYLAVSALMALVVVR
jgi:hypothetical protein